MVGTLPETTFNIRVTRDTLKKNMDLVLQDHSAFSMVNASTIMMEIWLGKSVDPIWQWILRLVEPEKHHNKIYTEFNIRHFSVEELEENDWLHVATITVKANYAGLFKLTWSDNTNFKIEQVR